MAREEIDFTAGSGSASEEEAYVDANSVREGDGRSTKETVIGNPEEYDVLRSDGSRQSFSNLQDYHDGKHGDDYTANKRRGEQRRDAATWCNRLELPDTVRDRVLYLLDRVDMRVGANEETTILALITLASDEFADGAHPRNVRQEDAYIDLLDSLPTSKVEVRRARENIHEQIY